MVIPIRSVFLVFLFALIAINSYSQKILFDKTLRDKPDQLTTFCVPNNLQNKNLLETEGIIIKYSVNDWLFITATPSWINQNMESGNLSDFYFEFAPPTLLSDTARAFHYVNEVHAGSGGLNSPYTGKNVIIGFVDTGIGFNHEDFKDSLGNTRVLNYWDQSMPDNGQSPLPYAYGQVWDSSEINAGLCTSMDDTGHGSTVAGQACGNARANGQNKGMAPDAKIVVVETDFTRPNWTLTVADACDYIFGIADDMGLPAVVNLSLGSYLGSHDGNDPAAIAIESMLDAKPGRIVVCAAGNSGLGVTNYGYHQQGNPTSDTNFVWFVNNPFGTAIYGPNTVAFDLWSDISDATWEFAYGLDTQSPSWDFRGRTAFHGAMSSIGTNILDTVWNNGNQLATIEVTTEIVGSNYHMLFVAHNDTTNYRYRFMTTGSGKYDLWSGEWMNLNNMYNGVPSQSVFPDSIYYVYRDTLQSVVSSWNCSEKVVSVGNMRNRLTHIDKNLNQYVSADNTPPGALSPNSSKGPNRHGLIKPDITAAGDVSLSAGPLWLLQNGAYNSAIDSNGVHVRNGGTSMASPVVAGIAALYLERCGQATYQDFLDDIHSTAYTDLFTGTVPNNAYGYGKAHALNALLQKTPPSQPIITSDFSTTLTSTSASAYQWYVDGTPINGETNQTTAIGPPYGEFEVQIVDTNGCTAWSEPFIVGLGLEENDLNKIWAFPNPAHTQITINSENEINSVQLISLDGSKIELSRKSKDVYDLSEVANGSYILKVITDEGTYHSKIVHL